jgi:hypothetical protein
MITYDYATKVITPMPGKYAVFTYIEQLLTEMHMDYPP